MKRLLVFMVASWYMSGVAQKSVQESKPPIDFAALNSWPYIGIPAITSDGKYVLYTINNKPVGLVTLIVQSSIDNWKYEIIGCNEGYFTADSKHVIFRRGDSLSFLLLGQSSPYKVEAIESFKLPVNGSMVKWIAYRHKDSAQDLTLYNVLTKEEKVYNLTKDYLFDDLGRVLMIKTIAEHSKILKQDLVFVNLENYDQKSIFSTKDSIGHDLELTNICFDKDAKRLSFMTKQNQNNKSINKIWLYDVKMKESIPIVTNDTFKSNSNKSISFTGLRFNKSGHWILFEVKELSDAPKENRNVKVNVWNYKDLVIQPNQLNPYLSSKSEGYTAAVNTESKKVLQITNQNEILVRNAENMDDYLVISSNSYRSAHWWTKIPNSFYLYSLKDNSKKLLLKGLNINFMYSFSPGGRFVVYFDPKVKHYFTYDIYNDKAINISKDIKVQLSEEYIQQRSNSAFPVGVVNWIEGDEALLIYDNYDIWQLDPRGIKKPISITNGYGLANNIKFRLVNEPQLFGEHFLKSDTLLLTAFSTENKNNGFFKKPLLQKGNPKLLTFDPSFYYVDASQIPNSLYGANSMRPVKANNENVWVVQRMSSDYAPNYLVTRNFQEFTAISNLQPQKDYNWFTTELIKWKQFDGTSSQGILYKPENFDPSKKYPIIFEYYEQLSFALNVFLQPEYTKSYINIPWFVSRGYLVFTPDIHCSVAITSGRTNGDNAYNSVVSAAQYLSKFPWIDKTRMGINGHSFGGGITNQLLIRTNIFRAAAEAAGVSDPISSYLHVSDRQSATELGQGRISATPWQRPDLYLKSSVVLNANKIVTPLLIMHNKDDKAVPWEQGVELFMALRRLGKKVWMLQYDDEGHVLSEKATEDFTIRLTQFFDHYLKDVAPPIWMTKGVSANLKGIDLGYKLDSSIK